MTSSKYTLCKQGRPLGVRLVNITGQHEHKSTSDVEIQMHAILQRQWIKKSRID